MMTDNELDNIFKNTLGNHEAPVPADMWNRVQPADDKKRRVAFWWKWYAIAAVFIIAGITAWWFEEQPAGNGNTVALSSLPAKTDRDQQLKTAPLLHKSQNDKDAVATSKTANEPFGNINHNTIRFPASTNESSGSKYLKDNKFATQKIPIVNSQENTARAQQQTNSSGKADSNSMVIVNPIAANGPLKNITNKAASSTDTAKATVNSSKKIKLPWTIEFFAAGAYSDKQTYDIPQESTFGPGALIEKPIPAPGLRSVGAGVRAGLPLTKNITLKAGLQFTQTREKIAYQQETINSFISVNAPADTSIFRQILYQPQNQQSTYNSIGIPLLISYEAGKKIRAGVTAGVVINARSWYKGKIPNADATATLIVKNTYKPVTGAALYLSLSASKKIGAIEVFAEPHLQYSLNSFTKATVPFKQKINSYGLSLGVRTALHK